MKAPKVIKLNMKLIHRILAQYKREDDKLQQTLFQECSRRKTCLASNK